MVVHFNMLIVYGVCINKFWLADDIKSSGGLKVIHVNGCTVFD